METQTLQWIPPSTPRRHRSISIQCKSYAETSTPYTAKREENCKAIDGSHGR